MSTRVVAGLLAAMVGAGLWVSAGAGALLYLVVFAAAVTPGALSSRSSSDT